MALTASGSGLDPHISPPMRMAQAARVARRAQQSAPKRRFERLVETLRPNGRMLGFIGEPRVNVLRLNLALDVRPKLTVKDRRDGRRTPASPGNRPDPDALLALADSGDRPRSR